MKYLLDQADRRCGKFQTEYTVFINLSFIELQVVSVIFTELAIYFDSYYI